MSTPPDRFIYIALTLNCDNKEDLAELDRRLNRVALDKEHVQGLYGRSVDSGALISMVTINGDMLTADEVALIVRHRTAQKDLVSKQSKNRRKKSKMRTTRRT